MPQPVPCGASSGPAPEPDALGWPMDDSDLVPLLALVMAVGAIGTIVPLLPGLALIWGAGLVTASPRGSAPSVSPPSP